MNKIESKNSQDLQLLIDNINKNLILLKIDFPKKSKIILDYIYYFNGQNFSTKDQIIANFIGFLDLHFIDQISDQNEYDKLKNKIFAQSIYGRDDNFCNMNSFSSYKGNLITESVVHKTNLAKIEELGHLPKNKYNVFFISEINQNNFSTEFKNDNLLTVFVINKDITYEEYKKLLNMNFPKNHVIIGKIKLSENTWNQFYFTDIQSDFQKKYNELFNCIGIYLSPDFPIIFPDIQTVIKARILQGKSIYGGENNGNLIKRFSKETKVNIEDILKSSSKRTQKTFKLRQKTNQDKISNLNDGHKYHYKRFFYDEKIGIPEVFLTNSGVAANHAVISEVLKNVPDTSKWYENDFYRENVENIKGNTIFRGTTQVFLASPSILSPERGLTKEKFLENLKSKISRFYENAFFNPNKTFYLIIDVTTNLTFDLKEFFPGIIPDNITIIKTFSLTKHQRGDTKYFLGGVAIYSDRDLQLTKNVEKNIEQNGFNLNSYQTLAYPRLRKSEIEKNRNNIEENRNAFKKGFFETIEKHKIGFVCPEIIDSDYFTFLITPIPEILMFLSKGTFPKEKVQNYDRESSKIVINDFVDENISLSKPKHIPCFIDVHDLGDVKTTLKDSFGLKYNNICSCFINYTKVFFNFFNDKCKMVEIPRVAFGFEKDLENSYKLGERVALMYKSFLIDIIEEYNKKNKKTD